MWFSWCGSATNFLPVYYNIRNIQFPSIIVMSSAKMIFILLAVAGMVAFAHVKTRSLHEVTAKELLGEWYTIGFTNPAAGAELFSCNRRSIKEGNGMNKLNVTENALWNKSAVSYPGTGEVAQSILNVEYPDQGIKSSFHIETFNDGHEMLWKDKGDGKHHTLLSLNSSASSEIKKKFEKEAKKDNVEVLYLDQDNCP